MTHNLRALVTLLAAVTGAEAAQAGWTAGDTRKAIDLAKSFVEPRLSTPSQTPGMSVAVSHNGQTVFADGFGYALPDVPVVPETVFKVGSISKQFTATAILHLMDRKTQIGSGRTLEFSTPISTILPKAAAWGRTGAARISMRHLLTMTSNLPNYTRRPPQSTNPWGSIQAPKLLAALADVRPLSGPGSFGYSNTAYFLLSEVLDSPKLAANQRSGYQGTLRALWKEVGLTHTDFTSDSIVGRRVAVPNYNRYRASVKSKRGPAFVYGDWLKGSADVRSTVVDLQKWNKALFQGKVLSQPMTKEMFSEAARVDVWTWYGMGWFVREQDGITYYTHSGSLPGFTSFNLIAEKKGTGEWSSVSVLTNSYGVKGLDTFANDLSDLTFFD